MAGGNLTKSMTSSKSLSSSGAGRHYYICDASMSGQDVEMLVAINLSTPMLTEYANRLAIPTKGLALSFPSHVHNDSKHMQEIQGLANTEKTNLHMGICSLASARALAPSVPILLRRRSISVRAVFWRRASGVMVRMRMPCPQHHTRHPLMLHISYRRIHNHTYQT